MRRIDNYDYILGAEELINRVKRKHYLPYSTIELLLDELTTMHDELDKESDKIQKEV